MKYSLIAALSIVFVGYSFAASAEYARKEDGIQRSRAAHMFNRIDSDKSGTISRREVIAQASQRFEETDTNGDGVLTKDELASYHRHKKAEKAQRRSARRKQDGADGERISARRDAWQALRDEYRNSAIDNPRITAPLR